MSGLSSIGARLFGCGTRGGGPTSAVRIAASVAALMVGHPSVVARAHVNPHRSCVYQFAMGIERPEQPCLVASNARLDSLERTFVDEKCSLHRAVVPPKPHGVPCCVVATASIGETECHARYSVGANGMTRVPVRSQPRLYCLAARPKPLGLLPQPCRVPWSAARVQRSSRGPGRGSR